MEEQFGEITILSMQFDHIVSCSLQNSCKKKRNVEWFCFLIFQKAGLFQYRDKKRPDFCHSSTAFWSFHIRWVFIQPSKIFTVNRNRENANPLIVAYGNDVWWLITKLLFSSEWVTQNIISASQFHSIFMQEFSSKQSINSFWNMKIRDFSLVSYSKDYHIIEVIIFSERISKLNAYQSSFL